MISTLIYRWTGEAMEPLARFMRFADKMFTVGEEYPLAVQEERSQAAHNHYFACVAEAWRNLPEHLAPRFPSPKHLRKYALIKAGFADERSIVCSTPEEALRVGLFIKPLDEYAVIDINDTVITVFTAQSQSIPAMRKDRFQESKEKVLEIVAGMIGVDVATLAAQSDIPAENEAASPTHVAPQADAASEAAPPVAAGGREPEAGSAAPSNLLIAYSEALFRANQLPSLEKIQAAFWKKNAWPAADDAACDKLDAVAHLHGRRARGELSAKQCMEEVKGLL